MPMQPKETNKLQLGAPTILINNAGIVRPKSILDSTAQDVEQYVKHTYILHHIV